MNLPIFIGYKTAEDPQEFMDEVQKILVAMGATKIDKAELYSYKLKDVRKAWCKMWQDTRSLAGGLITWELFKKVFLGRFFPRAMIESKVEEFINLKQDSVTVNEYSCPSIGGGRNTFGVRARFKNGHQSAGRSISQRSASPKGGGIEPKKGNEGDVQYPTKKCVKCGRTNGRERRVGTNACFGCGKSRHGKSRRSLLTGDSYGANFLNISLWFT
ncbi:uncharacterized protein [Solanum lycopersicum]|uniref:uncharacterized protein n=1 Tax=Solanum lycopersicum TaxID=4081 RepID=UPI00374A1FE7